MNEKKGERRGAGGGGSGWRWEQNRRLSQALGPGWGLRLGEPALALTRGPRVTLAAGARPWQADPRLTLPPRSEPELEPLPADPSMRRLDFSSVHLFPLQFGGK